MTEKRAPLTAEEVAREWRLLAAVPHAALLDFIREWMRLRRSWVTTLHLACFVLAAVATVVAILTDGQPGKVAVVQLAIAYPLLLVLLPLHEALHHVGYRLAGARVVRWSGSWRSMMVYVLADRFVARPRPLAAVALAPFVIINSVLVVAALTLPRWSVLLTALMTVHIMACAGDWAMLSFLWHHREEEVVTFDDEAARMTYFYAR